MSELANMLGEASSVHFEKVTAGTTSVVLRIDQEAIPKIERRTAAINSGVAERPVVDSYRRLNSMLREDNARGVYRQEHKRGQILVFPGRDQIVAKPAVVKQPGTIAGTLARIGATDEIVHLGMQIEGQLVSGCYTNKAIGKRLAHYIFESVRLSGVGRWLRTHDGGWDIIDFRVADFEVLDPSPLSRALAELRAIPSEWGENTIEELRYLRTGSSTKADGAD
jgi:hypothetical protein